ncbi:methyltransferase domain-containing protein [Candidatus Parcubacteria bacterium]|nr:methyltransferase domain-containing protein [Candidatus Parcubacteria bacterium]
MNNERKLNEIKHGEKISSNAEKVWGHSGKAGKFRVKRRIDLMVEMGKITEDSMVLELGCGTGEFTKNLANTKAGITAIDLSPHLLEIAKNNLKKFHNVKLEIGDMETLDNLPNNYFSNVVGNSVLHHVDYEKCLERSYNKLIVGGSIFFTEPNMMNPQIALQKNIPWLKKMMGDSPDEIAFFRWRLEKVLRKLGYKNIKVINFDFLHPIMPSLLVDILGVPLIFLEKIPIVKEISGSLLIYAEK